MNDLDIRIRSRGGRMRIPRSRGAATGVVLTLLGLWGAAAPFIGPHVDFANTATESGTWTAARGWLQVLPGVATVIGGLLLIMSRNRAIAMLGAWISVLGGAWFIAGRAVADLLGFGELSTPAATDDTRWAWVELTHFSALGVLIVFLAAATMGRLSVHSLRDIRHADAPVTITETPPDQHGGSQSAYGPQPSVETAADAEHSWRRRLIDMFGRRHASRVH